MCVYMYTLGHMFFFFYFLMYESSSKADIILTLIVQV